MSAELGRPRDRLCQILLESNYPRLEAWFKKQGCPADEAADQVMETFKAFIIRLNAAKQRPFIQMDTPAQAFLFGTARNVWRHWLRARRCRLEVLPFEALPPQCFYQLWLSASGAKRWEEVWLAMDGLKPLPREVLLLRFCARLTLEGAARHIGKSARQTWRIEKAALAFLRATLGVG